jgi:tetratricopeptide (TPR) repeat protein
MFACALAVFTAAPAAAYQDQKKSKDEGPKISEGEQKELAKINAAGGAAEKLKASADFLKKYGKSPMRPRVAAVISDDIARITDSAQRISVIEAYSKAFNQPDEIDLVKPSLIEAQLNAGKFEEAFNEAGKFVERHPENVVVLTQLAWAGANQAQKAGQSGQAPPRSILQKGSEASQKAIELMEADMKPEKMDAEFWNNYRNAWLPKLYQAHGVMLFFSEDKSKSREQLEKALGLDPYDAPTLLMVTNILNDEYNQLAQKYQTEKSQALLDKAFQKMDELIEYLARTAAITESEPQFQSMSGQIMENLKSYYAFRHEGKTDGLKELVEKFKKK